MKILAVDDNENSRVLLAELLKGEGYHVIEAVNGKKAFEMALEFMPNIIVSDILMPEMDGFELCRQIKSAPETSHIPFVFYTATYTTRLDKELGLSLGGCRFLMKPMENDIFLKKISEIVNEFIEEKQLAPENTLMDEALLKDKHIQALTNKVFNKDIKSKSLIEDYKQTKVKLKLAEEQMKQAQQAKRDFLSKAGHELRTPLNAILGYGQLLVMEPDNGMTPTQSHHVKEILKAGDYLLDLIVDLLDLSQIEGLKREFKFEKMKIIPTLNEVLSFLKPYSQEKGVQIKNHIPVNDGFYFKASPPLIKQVLLNLLNNAIKFNKTGGTISINSKMMDKNKVAFFIKDTGIGIPEHRLENLFELFSRLNTNSEERCVGLSITKSLVELMDGSIEVESTVGKGSCFKVVFPLAD